MKWSGQRRLLVPIALLTCLVPIFLVYEGKAFAQETTNDRGLVESVLFNANTFWDNEFQELGLPYTPAKLALIYNKPVDTACGSFSSMEGPFYCPEDETIYYPVRWLDDGRTLASYGAPAVEWAIGHEVGHNVQVQMYKLGIQSLRPFPETPLVEMQADCFAGMYTNQAITSPGGIDAVLAAMQIISQQRIAAFELGYKTGDLSQCLALATGGAPVNSSDLRLVEAT